MDDKLRFLIAEAGIRRLYARYADAVWRQDFAAFGACFAEAASWEIAGERIEGREAIARRLEAFLQSSERVMLFAGSPLLDVGDGVADGRVPITEYIKRHGGAAERTLGVYTDRFVEAGDRWLFLSHRLTLAYAGPADFSAPYRPFEDA